MRPISLRQVEATNAGFALFDTPALLRARESYRRLLRQIEGDPAAGLTAEENVRGYLAELDGAIAAREEAAA